MPSEMEDMWAKKVELPDFTGIDPIGWVARAERFFEDQEIHSSDKLQWAFMSMEGEAMLWFHSWCQKLPRFRFRMGIILKGDDQKIRRER